MFSYYEVVKQVVDINQIRPYVLLLISIFNLKLFKCSFSAIAILPHFPNELDLNRAHILLWSSGFEGAGRKMLHHELVT